MFFLQELLSRKDLVNKDEFLYKFFSAIGPGLANLNGAVWRAHRRAFQPAFHPSLLERYDLHTSRTLTALHVDFVNS